MSAKDNIKFVIQNFRAAGRLINEWRDTVGYSAWFAATAGEVASSGRIDAMGALLIMLPASREAVRSYGWTNDHMKMRLVGDQRPSLNGSQLTCSALSGTFIALLAGSPV